jgi:DNA invertase Pin-like site-specific DNA recombinase
MLVGYARVSTQEQTLDLQKDALESIGCAKIYSDVVSGAKAERKGLQEALEYVREGDTLVAAISDDLLSAAISTPYILGFRKDNPNLFNSLIQNWLHF